MLRSASSLGLVLAAVLAMALAPRVWAQSIQTEGNIETDATLVSKVATGTPPVVVQSSTLVANLNADQVDGHEGTDLGSLILALQDQLTALGPARVPRTGQTSCSDAVASLTRCGTGVGLGQDGDLQAGATWPNPRFTDHGDGTVSDALTGLVWLKDANCFGAQTWANALARSNALFDGCSDCGGTDNDCNLSDGSVPGDWRLPDVRELQSLVHYGAANPAIPSTAGTGQWVEGDPFTGVQSQYLSSTSLVTGPFVAWVLDTAHGEIRSGPKTDSNKHVWPVRDGR